MRQLGANRKCARSAVAESASHASNAITHNLCGRSNIKTWNLCASSISIYTVTPDPLRRIRARAIGIAASVVANGVRTDRWRNGVRRNRRQNAHHRRAGFLRAPEDAGSAPPQSAWLQGRRSVSSSKGDVEERLDQDPILSSRIWKRCAATAAKPCCTWASRKRARRISTCVKPPKNDVAPSSGDSYRLSRFPGRLRFRRAPRRTPPKIYARPFADGRSFGPRDPDEVFRSRQK